MKCSLCPAATGVILVERLNPRNLRPVHAHLCPRCAKRLGYRPVDHGRGFVSVTAVGAPPQWVMR